MSSLVKPLLALVIRVTLAQPKRLCLASGLRCQTALRQTHPLLRDVTMICLMCCVWLDRMPENLSKQCNTI